MNVKAGAVLVNGTSPGGINIGATSGFTQGTRALARAWRNTTPYKTEPNLELADLDEEAVEAVEKRHSVVAPRRSTESSWVNGAVLKVESESVLCDLVLSDQHWEVSLARSFFPEGVRYGTPVRISMRDIDGYRTPLVEVVDRRPQPDPELEKLKAQLLAL
jgi:hypothetical protein